MQQFNFATNAVDPTQAVSGFIGQNQQSAEAQMQAQQQMMQNQYALQKQMYSRQLLGRAMSPEGTAEDWGRLATVIDPAAYKAANDHWSTMNTNQQQDALQNSGSAWAAYMNNSPEVAAQIIQARIDAVSAQPGGGDKAQLAFLNGILQTGNKDPKAAAAQLGIGLATMPGGKDAMDAYYKQGSLSADNALKDAQASEYPSKIKQNEAQADQATAEARLKNLEALYKGTGTLTPIEKAAAESDLRNELLQNPQYKAYQIAKVAADSMKVASANGAGDLNLIYNLNKILDPNSVVRESEFATAASTGGLPASVMSYISKLDGSGMLPDNVRTQLLNEANRMIVEKENQISGIKNGITGIARRRGLATENIFYDAKENGDVPTTKQASQKGYFDVTKMTITGPDGTIYKYSDPTKFMDALKKGQTAGVF